jgi:hypothetical protein
VATTLQTFLTDLAENPAKVDDLIDHPDATLDEAGLSDTDKELLKSRDWHRIQKALNEAFKPEGLNVNVTVPVVVVVV